MSSFLNEYFKDTPPAKLIAGTAAASLLSWATYKVVTDPEGVKKSLLSSAFEIVKAVPGAQGKIDEELGKALSDMEKDLHFQDDPYKLTRMPAQGWENEKILEALAELQKKEVSKYGAGKVSGCVYHGGQEHTELQSKAVALFALSNPLHPDVFPAIRKFEAEIVAMTVGMLGGGVPTVCGAVTSGGTESILMAVKTHREYYMQAKGIKHPEIVCPVSAHAAFDKACKYFRIKMVHVPCGPDHRADVAKMRAAITPNTLMLVGSAPSYPHGMVDDITALGKLAQEFDIGLHVDGCLGGFLLPWQQKLGYEIPPFDFSVPGVTSMSADTHKYGYAIKGTSVVLYRTPQLRRAMYFVHTDWPGGIYCSPTISGSRPGCLIAACWASLVSIGEDGFMRNAKAITETHRAIKAGIPKISGLELCGDSHTMVVSFISREFDVFMVSDAMSKRGWNLNALQKPNAVHLCVTFKHAGKEEVFLKDLKDSVEEVKADPNAFKNGAARVYGMAHGLPDRGIVADIISGYLDVCLKV